MSLMLSYSCASIEYEIICQLKSAEEERAAKAVSIEVKDVADPLSPRTIWNFELVKRSVDYSGWDSSQDSGAGPMSADEFDEMTDRVIAEVSQSASDAAAANRFLEDATELEDRRTSSDTPAWIQLRRSGSVAKIACARTRGGTTQTLELAFDEFTAEFPRATMSGGWIVQVYAT